jgi:superfamily I DNA/RNA helicase
MEEEERRVLFVAMSRAASRLFLTYSKHLSPFLRQVLQSESDLVPIIDHLKAYNVALGAPIPAPKNRGTSSTMRTLVK